MEIKFIMLVGTFFIVLGMFNADLVYADFGVHVSDQFLYSMESSWYTNTGVSPPSDLAKSLDLAVMNYTIYGISGPRISVNRTYSYKNGTFWSETFSGDYGGGDFLPTNLNAGDAIPEANGWMINGTITRAYGNANRLTNYVNVNITLWEQFPNANFTEYWDKVTGAMVERRISYFNESGANTTDFDVLIKIKYASLWTVPEFPSFLIPSLFMITMLAAIIVYRRRRLT